MLLRSAPFRGTFSKLVCGNRAISSKSVGDLNAVVLVGVALGTSPQAKPGAQILSGWAIVSSRGMGSVQPGCRR